jgi:hypothetical protein
VKEYRNKRLTTKRLSHSPVLANTAKAFEKAKTRKKQNNFSTATGKKKPTVTPLAAINFEIDRLPKYAVNQISAESKRSDMV